MPKGKGYSTGGVHDTGGKDYGAENGTGVDVGRMGAGMGNYQGPNSKDYHPLPGGKGSRGKRSSSKATSK